MLELEFVETSSSQTLMGWRGVAWLNLISHHIYAHIMLFRAREVQETLSSEKWDSALSFSPNLLSLMETKIYPPYVNTLKIYLL